MTLKPAPFRIAPKRILAMKLRAMGDTVLMTAPLVELKKRYPQAEIHVVVTHLWAPLLQGHPAITKVWPYEYQPSATARARSLARMAFQLRPLKFDWAINFHASPSSAALIYATGAPVRSIHFHGLKDKNRFSNVEIPGKGITKPIIERDMDAIRALGVTCPIGLMPELQIQDSEIKRAEQHLISLKLEGPILALGLGASRPTKIWSLERMASIALRWISDRQGSVLSFSSRDEAKLLQSFLDHIDKKLLLQYSDIAERRRIRGRIFSQVQMPLRHMGALMKLSCAYIGPDSGPKHIAVASGTPTVTLFGPEDPFEWHPYSIDQHPYHFMEGLSCRRDQEANQKPWCGLHTCVIEEHRCMTSILEDDVYRSLNRVAR